MTLSSSSSSSLSPSTTTTPSPNTQHSKSKPLLRGVFFLGVLVLQIPSVHSWATPCRRIETQPSTTEQQRGSSLQLHHHHHRHQHNQQVVTPLPRTFKTALNVFETEDKTAATAARTTKEASTSASTSTSDIEQTTESYGLEAGLFQSLKQNDGGQSAKDLLAKYGAAYLATSIPLAIVSFALCYLLVDSGVDVAALLSNVGIEVSESGEKVGTFALAYAAHKAASPIRFPPTVLLTPIVAKMIGKEPQEEEEKGEKVGE